MGRRPFSINQILDCIDGGGLFYHLVRASVSGKEFVAPADWRCEEHVGIDRILRDGWIVFNERVEVRLLLLVSCYRD